MSESPTPFVIRPATVDDLPAINDIYNHYVTISTTTYDYDPLTLDERRAWFEGRAEIHPVMVVTEAKVIVAWGSLNTFRGRVGYRTTAENSIYVHPDHHRRGLGRLLLSDQIDRARSLGLHAIVAGIDSAQVGSIKLHEKFGFKQVGYFPEVGRKFDRWCDAVFMMLVLE